MARVLPFGPVRVVNVEVFLIPLGWETTNSKTTFVFAEIKSRSFGVKEKDYTTGRSLAWATPGAKPIINNMATSADLIFILSPLVIPNLIMDRLINTVLWRRMRDLNPR